MAPLRHCVDSTAFPSFDGAMSPPPSIGCQLRCATLRKTAHADRGPPGPPDAVADAGPVGRVVPDYPAEHVNHLLRLAQCLL